MLTSVFLCDLIQEMKKIRFNANFINSERLRKIQAEYEKKFAPLKCSLDTLANLSLEYGADKVRDKLNLS